MSFLIARTAGSHNLRSHFSPRAAATLLGARSAGDWHPAMYVQPVSDCCRKGPGRVNPVQSMTSFAHVTRM